MSSGKPKLSPQGRPRTGYSDAMYMRGFVQGIEACMALFGGEYVDSKALAMPALERIHGVAVRMRLDGKDHASFYQDVLREVLG